MSNRYLRGAGLLVGLLILCFAILDFAAVMWPFELRSLPWRYGAMTTLSGSLVTPSIAFLLLFSVVVGRSRGLQLSVAFVVGAFGLGLGAGWVVFVLDVLQLRGGVRAEVLPQYDVAAGRALTKLGIGAVAALLFSVIAFKASRDKPKASQPVAPSLIRPGRVEAFEDHAQLHSRS